MELYSHSLEVHDDGLSMHAIITPIWVTHIVVVVEEIIPWRER
jgi:hypothetical protein